MEFDVVAFADADEASWNVPAESPEEVVGTIIEFLDDLANLEVDDDFGSVFARDGWRNFRACVRTAISSPWTVGSTIF